MKNKVKKDNEFEYEENVREFTGLIFHCPKCDNIFHLHIAEVSVNDTNLKTSAKKPTSKKEGT